MSDIFPVRLKEARERSNMKQSMVGQKLHVSNSTIHGYEKGKAKPDPKTLVSLSDLYDVSVDWLLGRTDIYDLHKQGRYDTIDLSKPSFLLSKVKINNKTLTTNQKRKIAALALILFDDN